MSNLKYKWTIKIFFFINSIYKFTWSNIFLILKKRLLKLNKQGHVHNKNMITFINYFLKIKRKLLIKRIIL